MTENSSRLTRRQTLAAAAAGAVVAGSGGGVARAQSAASFKLKYAPHFGMFRHHAGADLVDQLKFMRQCLACMFLRTMIEFGMFFQHDTAMGR